MIWVLITNNAGLFVSFTTILERKMKLEDLEIGDVVYAAHNIINDGSMPDNQAGDILALSGARGVIVMLGYVEEEPTKNIFFSAF